jgi:hypothetical protein
VAQLVLPGIEEVDQHSVEDEDRHSPDGAPRQGERGSGQRDGAEMRADLQRPGTIGRDAERSQPGRVDQVASDEDFLHGRMLGALQRESNRDVRGARSRTIRG